MTFVTKLGGVLCNAANNILFNHLVGVGTVSQCLSDRQVG